MATRAFPQGVERLVRRATIVNSADDIRRVTTQCLADGTPCTLELGSNIVCTAGFTIPGGLKAFSLDGAQRFKLAVNTPMARLFLVECLDVEIGNLEVVVKNGSTLASVFDVNQPSNIYPSLKVSNARFTGITEDNPIAIDSLFSQQENAGIARQAVVDVSKVIVEGAQRLVAVDDVDATWLTSTFRDMRLSRVGGFGSLPDVLIGGGAASSGFIGCVFENISGRFNVDLGQTSDASSFSNLLVLGAGAIPTFRTNATGPGQAITLKRVEFMLRALSVGDVDLDNISGGGGGGTFGQATATFTVGLDSVTISVIDAGVTSGSNIVLSVGTAPGREADEYTFAPVHPAVASVTAGVGFDILVVCPDADADGAYLINYTRD